MSTFPSVVSSFSDPTASDRLNSPSHSALHSSVNSAVEQVERFIGTLPSSAVGTILYDVRSPDSDGGGHVQTANKGGTGQTSFNKGDLLTGLNSSTLGKFAVGVDNQVLVADSSVASGMKWAVAPGNKLTVVGSVVSLRSSSTTETSVFSVSVPGSTLGTNNAVRARSYVNLIELGSGASVMAQVNYGGSPVASVILVPLANTTSVVGTLEAAVMATGTATSQRATITLQAANAQKPAQAQASVFFASNTKTAAIDSAANQTFGVTIRPIVAGASFDVEGTIVEKIN